jgi:spermidine synthase
MNRDIKLLLFITGFVSSSVQFIMLREIVCLCGGSEIITGVFLAIWLILSSLGSYRTHGDRNINEKILFLLFAISPLISLFLFIVTTRILIHTGETPSLLSSILMLIITLAPTAIISSRTFIFLSNKSKDNRHAEPGNSFGIETVGSVVAGIFSTTIVIFFISTFLYFFIIVTLTFLILILALYKLKLPSRIFLYILTSVVVVLIVRAGPDILIRELQFRNIVIKNTFDTPFGNITTGNYDGEEVTFYDFRPLFFNNDNIHCEEDIHFAMLQTERHDSLLLISGGLLNHLPEILKYHPTHLVYIEHDPGLIKTENIKDTTAGSLSINVLTKDAFSFLKQRDEKFNVIIQLVRQPSTLTLNRFYCREYFANVKKNLTENGVFVCSPLPTYNYVSDSYKNMLASIINALKCSFRNVTVIPGSSLYIIATDGIPETDICQMTMKKGIKNLYVNCDYFNDNEINRRSVQLLSGLNPQVPPNSLMKPVASWFGNSLMLEKQGRGKLIIAVLSLFIVISVLKIKRGTLLIYSSSFALSGLGVTIIFLFQAMLGNAHLLSALILSLLFSGLATGASIGRTRQRPVIFYPMAIAVTVLITGLIAGTISFREYSSFIPIAFLLLVFTAGIFAGSLYRIMTSSRSSISTERVYGADLSGSATGYLLTGTLLIPMTGLLVTTFILSGIILISVFIVSVAPKL